MSIIYDALKKIETGTKDTAQKPTISKGSNNKFIRIVCILCILIIIGFIGFFMGKPSVSPPTQISSLAKESDLPTQTKLLPFLGRKTSLSIRNLPPLSLNGIFFSEGEYLALINDQMVKKGDFIMECQIQKIEPDGVEIKFGDSSFRLNYP